MVIDINLSNHLRVKRLEAPSIPQPSLTRLPQYHHYLLDLEAKGVTRISCSVVGANLGFIPVQVRKDLQYTGIVGKPKTGYSVAELIQAIETFLGWNNINEAFLVGARNLGTALLGHGHFSKFGLRVVAPISRKSCRSGRPECKGRHYVRRGLLPQPAPVAGHYWGSVQSRSRSRSCENG